VTGCSPSNKTSWDSITSKNYTFQDVMFFNGTSGQEETLAWKITPAGDWTLTWAAYFNDAQQSSRSAQVLALSRTTEVSYIFDCQSTVSQMYTSTEDSQREEFILPDESAMYFAGAIAGKIPPGDSVDDLKFYTQYSDFFDDRNLTGYYETELSAENIASTIQLFSLSSMSAFDLLGPRISVPGNPPQLAQGLKIQWTWVTAILVGIPVTQFLLLCVTAYISSNAVIKDASFLAAAHLLKPVVEKLGPHGCIMSGRDIARHLGNQPVVYGVRDPQGLSAGPIYHVDLISQSEAIEAQRGSVWMPGMKMPKGWYDGIVYQDPVLSISRDKMDLEIESRSRIS
jgi:hypothetical protein